MLASWVQHCIPGHGWSTYFINASFCNRQFSNNFPEEFEHLFSSVYKISRMGGEYREQSGGGTFLHWRNKKLHVFQTRKFSKNFKKIDEKFTIFEKTFEFAYKNLNGKLIFYPFSLPFSMTFVISYTSGTYQNFGGKFRLGGTFDFGGSGGWRGCINPRYLN